MYLSLAKTPLTDHHIERQLAQRRLSWRLKESFHLNKHLSMKVSWEFCIMVVLYQLLRKPDFVEFTTGENKCLGYSGESLVA
jgi:hypothetical protein